MKMNMRTLMLTGQTLMLTNPQVIDCKSSSGWRIFTYYNLQGLSVSSLVSALPPFIFLNSPDIFFCRSLPSAYITEYLLHQEHLSFVRFFHHTINNFFRAEPSSTVSALATKTNKWCVFMRTSGELLRLHTDAKLQELLVSPLVELEEVLERQDEELSISSK